MIQPGRETRPRKIATRPTTIYDPSSGWPRADARKTMGSKYRQSKGSATPNARSKAICQAVGGPSYCLSQNDFWSFPVGPVDIQDLPGSAYLVNPGLRPRDHFLADDG